MIQAPIWLQFTTLSIIFFFTQRCGCASYALSELVLLGSFLHVMISISHVLFHCVTSRICSVRKVKITCSLCKTIAVKALKATKHVPQQFLVILLRQETPHCLLTWTWSTKNSVEHKNSVFYRVQLSLTLKRKRSLCSRHYSQG